MSVNGVRYNQEQLQLFREQLDIEIRSEGLTVRHFRIKSDGSAQVALSQIEYKINPLDAMDGRMPRIPNSYSNGHKQEYTSQIVDAKRVAELVTKGEILKKKFEIVAEIEKSLLGSSPIRIDYSEFLAGYVRLDKLDVAGKLVAAFIRDYTRSGYAPNISADLVVVDGTPDLITRFKPVRETKDSNDEKEQEEE